VGLNNWLKKNRMKVKVNPPFHFSSYKISHQEQHPAANEGIASHKKQRRNSLKFREKRRKKGKETILLRKQKSDTSSFQCFGWKVNRLPADKVI